VPDYEWELAAFRTAFGAGTYQIRLARERGVCRTGDSLICGKIKSF